MLVCKWKITASLWNCVLHFLQFHSTIIKVSIVKLPVRKVKVVGLKQGDFPELGEASTHHKCVSKNAVSVGKYQNVNFDRIECEW